MKNRLLWKLLLTNILPVIGVIFLIVWFAVDKLAANYFMALMETYDVSPDEIHQMFLTSIHYYLVWASLAALGLAIVLSYLLTRRVLRPLSQMTAITKEVAAGNFSLRTKVKTNDEVGELAVAFNKMADSLEQIEQLRKNMVADVAHELRTPLTNLRGYLEALHDGIIPPTTETFQMLQQENLRLVHLVENLQQLARADAARAYLKREKLNLGELVQQMVELQEPNFRAKNIGVFISDHARDVMVAADPDKVLQALRNMTENCWKYTPAGGQVTISVAAVNSGIKVDFQNSGPGILKEDLPYVFERFFRADRSRSRDAGGAGIGLAITRELIEAHGGQVGAESRPEETHIWFTLPV
ncbi:cell wall metabolism sensor histidine kinase WalK [Desulforhopalus sp. IMCC35007]|uniref:sensor histidine kinase n=1 Tax=Desulforhopalus sp. IMCC35007 TaxID=2569543 RepID=UPI00145ED679|nr:ATP-binding protein [Desulforhopalus sp. IMCC35007]